MERTTRNSKIINSKREKIFDAFVNKKALEFWLAPYGMTGKIHAFDLKVGGGYEMSLFYDDNTTDGKTSLNEDRFSAKFIEISPNEKITQVINFLSDDTKFQDEMVMEVVLEELTTDSTKVTIVFKNIPAGIELKDNEDGTEQSLEKLAKYIENN